MDFSKLIAAVNQRLISIPLDLTPKQEPELKDAGGSGNVRKHRPCAVREWSPFQAIVQRMSNHQRNQWARAGYPGLKHEDIKPLERFVGAI